MRIDPPYLQVEPWPDTDLTVTTRFRDAAGKVEFDLNSKQADKEQFANNLGEVKQHMRLQSMAALNQVHGRRLVRVDEDNMHNLPEADGLYTTTPGLGLMIRQADCQAIALYAPGLAANLHVGWRGNVQNLPGRALAKLCQKFRLSPKMFQAYISPSLGPCCAEFVNYEQEFPEEFRAFMIQPNYFNLWAISAWQLISQGLMRSNLSISGICTKCNHNFYSFRRGDEGRFATIVALKEDK